MIVGLISITDRHIQDGFRPARAGITWTYPRDICPRVFKQIDGKWYFFRPNGLMAMGWINLEDGKWYYMLNDGSMVTGWLKIGNDYYFMRGNGTMAAAWDGRGVVLFQSNGKCVVNSWAQIKDNWYLFGTDGKMMTGWAKSG